jgi:hypothetical protein
VGVRCILRLKRVFSRDRSFAMVGLVCEERSLQSALGNLQSNARPSWSINTVARKVKMENGLHAGCDFY